MTTLNNIYRLFSSVTMSLFFGIPQLSLAAELSTRSATAEMVVTIQPSGPVAATNIQPEELKIYQSGTPRIVTGIDRLSGDRAAMELYIYVDDSIDSMTFETLRPDLERFIRALPETTKVAVGNSTTTQSFTADHEMVARSLKQMFQESDT